MQTRSIAVSLMALILLFVPNLSAQQQHGGITLRIPDTPSPRCINSTTDEVWLTLYRVVITKKNGWFQHQNQVEVVLNVQTNSQPQAPKPLSFPLSSKVNIRDYQQGQVSVPVEYPLVSGLKLTQGTGANAVNYTGFALDTTLVNLEGKTALGATLDALNSATGSKKVPIPDNPYTQVAGYLLEFASNAVTNSINDHNSDDKYTTETMALNFDPTGTCADSGPDGSGFETTGTKAFLMSDGIQGSGYVPIDQTSNYCWIATTQPSFIISAAKKIAGTPCSDSSYNAKYVPVTNNFVAYFLQKRQVSGHLGINASRDKTESLQLCHALGVVESACPAGK